MSDVVAELTVFPGERGERCVCLVPEVAGVDDFCGTRGVASGDESYVRDKATSLRGLSGSGSSISFSSSCFASIFDFS